MPTITHGIKFCNSRPAFYGLVGLGCLVEGGFLSLVALGDLTEQAGGYVAVCTMLFGLLPMAWWLIKRTGFSQKQAKRPTLLVIFFFAALFRLTMVVAAPSLSTDEFRYVWEGRLVTLGISPYRYAPSDPALEPYHSPIWPLVQQKESTSPYPPLNQVVGAVEYLALGDNLLGPKLTSAVFDLLNCAALVWLLGLYGLDRRKVVLYAWCPLPIIEFAQSGHNDALMLLLMLVAIGLARLKRPAFSAVVLGLACLAKFTPLFALPLFLAGWQTFDPANPPDWRGLLMAYLRRWYYPALTLAVIVAGYLPFLWLGRGAIGSILEYTGSWRDNEAELYRWSFDFFGLTVAKAVSLLVLGGILALLSLWPRLALGLGLSRRIGLALGVTLLVASTVHTWYLSWVLVLLPLVWGEDGWGLWDWGCLLFAAAAELPYLTYIYNGQTRLYDLIRPLEYWPVHLLLFLNVALLWRKTRRVKGIETAGLPAEKGLSKQEVSS